MNKTKFSITMNYQMALKQAQSLEKCANELSSCLSDAEEERSRISACWQGDSVHAYIAKLNANIENTKRVRKEVLNISSTIKRIAKRTYDAEMKALEISQRRTYN